MGFFQFFSRKKKEEETIESMVGSTNNGLLELLSPDSIEEKDSYLRLGGNYVRTMVVAHFSKEVEANFLEKLHNINANVSVCHHIEPTSSEHMIKHLNRAVIEYRSRLSEPNLRPRDQIQIETDLQDAEILLENLTTGKSELFNEHMLIHIQAGSLEQLEQITQQVKNLTNKYMKAMTPHTRMMDAFLSVLPLGQNRIRELSYRNFDAESLSSVFPFDDSNIFSEKGIIKGRNLKSNSIVIVDHDALLNRNEVVIGTSGGGKSTYLWGDMMRRWILGAVIRVIDPKAEFGEKVTQLGGEWIKISPLSGNIINPFEITNVAITFDEDTDLVESSLLHQKVSRLKTMFCLMHKDLKNQQVELALLEKAIVETYKEKGIDWKTNFSKLKSNDYPIMEDLYNKITKLIDRDESFKPLSGFYQVLYPYVEGSYARAFNGHTNVDLSNDLVVFDLFDLRNESDLQQVAMYNILTFLQDDAMRDKTRVKQIFVDEAHILADPKNPMAMEFLASMYKLIRSFKGGVTSATQQVGDFLSAVDGAKNYGEAVILNSVTKLYLPMLKEEMNTIMTRTSEGFSEEEQRLLVVQEAERHRNAGRGIYVVGGKKVNLQVELTPEELKLWDREWYEKKYKTKLN